MLAKQNITLLGELGFENAYALVMPRRARRGARHPHASPISPRAPRTCRSPATTNSSRGRNGPALRKAYGLSFRAQRQMQPDFMYAAVASGEVDVIAGYTSDGLIAKYDLVVLDDPKHAIPPYDAIMLLSPQRAGDESVARGADARCSARSTSRRCARPTSAPPATSDEFAGCGGAMAVGEDREEVSVLRSLRVIASVAKQSIVRHMRRHGLLRCARNDADGAGTQSPLIIPPSISMRLNRRASAPFLHA